MTNEFLELIESDIDDIRTPEDLKNFLRELTQIIADVERRCTNEMTEEHILNWEKENGDDKETLCGDCGSN